MLAHTYLPHSNSNGQSHQHIYYAKLLIIDSNAYIQMENMKINKRNSLSYLPLGTPSLGKTLVHVLALLPTFLCNSVLSHMWGQGRQGGSFVVSLAMQ